MLPELHMDTNIAITDTWQLPSESGWRESASHYSQSSLRRKFFLYHPRVTLCITQVLTSYQPYVYERPNWWYGFRKWLKGEGITWEDISENWTPVRSKGCGCHNDGGITPDIRHPVASKMILPALDTIRERHYCRGAEGTAPRAGEVRGESSCMAGRNMYGGVTRPSI